MGCHDLLQNGHAVAIIKNQQGDSYANVYSNARNTYYNIIGYPTAFFDGLNPFAGGSPTQSMYSSYLPRVNARLAVPSHFTISAQGAQVGNQFQVAVTVSKPEADTNTNVRLHAVLTESNIPQVWFNQTTVENVNRLMTPDQNGTPISLNTGETTTVNLAFNLNTGWNISNCEVVFFLQNQTTKEILQGVKYSLAQPTNLAAQVVNNTHVNLTWTAAQILDPPTRTIDGYKVWRLQQGQESNESAWELLTPNIISATEYNDYGWVDVLDGFYTWAVRSCYSSGVVSVPAFSNSLFRLRPPIIEVQIPDLVLNMNGSYTLAPVNTYFSSSDEELHYEVEGNINITVSYLPDGQIVLTPATSWFGVEHLLIRAVDRKGQSAEQLVKVTVLETWGISENFDHEGALPPGWSVTHSGTTTYPWQPWLVEGADYGMITMASLGNTALERLVSVPFDLSAYKDIQISFSTDFLPYASGTATFAYSFNNVLYSTVETMNAAFSGTKSYAIPALDKKPVVYLRWTYTNGAANTGQVNHWIVDDLSLSGLVVDNAPPSEIQNFAVAELEANAVTFGWEPVTELYFSRYEIYISTDDQMTTADQLWSVGNDPLLENIGTNQTTVTDLADGYYWAAIRAIDQSNNSSGFSSAVSFHFFAPLLNDPIPSGQPLPDWSASRSVTIGCTVEYNYDLDLNSLRFRHDQNRNGVYDPEEAWQAFTGRSQLASRNSQITLEQVVEFPEDGIFYFEIKASSLSGLTAYSGIQGIQGIADDWMVRIDTTSPADMTAFFVENVADNSVQLTWAASSDINFDGYRIYYGNHPGITLADAPWDKNSDPALQYQGTGLVSTTITGLIPATRYYFRLYAADEAGWMAAFPEEITAMTSASAAPLAPQNVTLSVEGDQLLIDWDDVTTDIYGNPIGISYYGVYIGEQPYFACNEESLLVTTTGSSIALDNILEYVDRIFFKIVAVSGAIRSRPPAK